MLETPAMTTSTSPNATTIAEADDVVVTPDDHEQR
jgi:hypothetical protein